MQAKLYYKTINILKNGTREVAEWLRALAVLRKDMGFILSTHVTTDNQLSVNPVPCGPSPFFWPLQALYAHSAQT